MSPPNLGRPPVLLDIVEEHFDELDFLWEQREGNVFTPDWDLADLAGHEERAEAHLDGLRLAELHAVDMARELLASGETFATTAACLVLARPELPECEPLVLQALLEGGRPTADGIRFALRHHATDGLLAALGELASGAEPIPAAVACDVLAFRSLPAASAERFLSAEDSWLRELGLGCLGRTGGLQQEQLVDALQHAEPAVRRAALQAAARSRTSQLATHCRAAATRSSDPDPEALHFLGVLGEPADIQLIEEALARPELGPWAISALGAMGRVETIPRLIELMSDDTLGLAATAAYRRITGADDVEGPKPFPPPPVAEGEDEQEELPPDPARAAADWARRSGAMDPELAWQWGHALEEAQLPAGFDALRLDSRRDVYLRLRSRPTALLPELELEALVQRQRGS